MNKTIKNSQPLEFEVGSIEFRNHLIKTNKIQRELDKKIIEEKGEHWVEIYPGIIDK